MKKKYGLLFLLCLLMFFCVNIDGAQARLDEGGGGKVTKNDGPKSCLYSGTLPSYSVDSTSSAAAIALTYDCTYPTSPKCKAEYYAVKHSETSSSGTVKFTLDNSYAFANDTNMSHFYNNTIGIYCPAYLYVGTVYDGTSATYNMYYTNATRAATVFHSKTFSGDVNSAADKLAKEGGSSSRGDSDSTENQDMTDDIKKRAKEEREKQGNSNIDTTQINCSEVLGDKFTTFLKSAFLIISVGGIVLLIVFASLDFIKVITASEDNAMSEAFKKVKNRIIAVIILLLLPLLVNFLIGIVNKSATVVETVDSSTGKTVKKEIKIGKLDDCNIAK